MKRAAEIFLALLGAALIGATLFYYVLALIVGFTGQEQQHPQRALETITRYETVINGERIECERREDHVRGITEVAC